MPGLLEEANLLFGTSNLYEILNVAKKSSKAEIKKAYYKVSLAVHPDKCDEAERESATKKFQVLGKAYSILVDKDLRAAYDETGSVAEDECELLHNQDWTAYWRKCFPKVSVDDIRRVEKSYKGSEEEKNDLIKAYKKNKGDMDGILNEVMCSTVDDEPRFRQILSDLISAGELECHEAFFNEEPKKKKSRKNWYNKEAEEAKEMLEKLKEKGGANDNGSNNNNNSDDDDALRSLIAGNMRSRASAMEKRFAELESQHEAKRRGAKKSRVAGKMGNK